jgi:hypothetical protein
VNPAILHILPPWTELASNILKSMLSLFSRYPAYIPADPAPIINTLLLFLFALLVFILQLIKDGVKDNPIE